MLSQKKSIWAVLFGILLLSGCKGPGNESTGVAGKDNPALTSTVIDFNLKKIKDRGSLIAIVDNSSTGYFLYKGQPMGYDYDLLQLFAEHLGVRLEIKITQSIDNSFKMLNQGKGDIIANQLTVTKERKKLANFTNSHYTTRQVLVQRKPDNWRQLTLDQFERAVIRNQVDLIGKELYVRRSSAYADRLHNLAHEIGGDIIIIETEDSLETESLIKMVARGDLLYTVADESVALVNASYYSNIDVKTPISFPQQIAWAVRKNDPELLDELNDWLRSIKRQPTFNVIYNKYYRSPRAFAIRAKSDFSSISGQSISAYDDVIKAAADSIGWNWLLLASQIYQESRFDPNAKSWAGAIGLMQLIPETGKRYGARQLTDPIQSIWAGVGFLRYLDGLWAGTIHDEEERIKFVLASYNVGLGHVVDARNLAKKYGKDPTVWDNNVEYYLLHKSKKEYMNDPIVRFGYCRGEEPVNYVHYILNRYYQYEQLMNS
ncbi:transporter substrate-binding domain-containing protein [Fulvivirga sp. M361]|uniref:transporter substrate-binding domain-containing protein n=1 Tax=Fulvivirga sp. M361 TaxID=2594266 RepID=UPI002107752F|nr:transporter substrate-binding domain-containing protein [Fulvivirga sp. M361]